LNSTAAKKRPVRERFSGPPVVAGIIAGFLLLLLFLYPEQSLRRLLSSEGERTPAGRVYLEAALKSRPDDHQLRLVLAQTWLGSGCYRKALQTLDGFKTNLPVEIQRETDALRYTILREQLQMEEGNRTALGSFQVLARRQLQWVQNDQELAQIEFDAASLNLPDIAEAARIRRKKLHPVPEATPASAEQYRADAAAAFAAMEKVKSTTERRTQFIKGVQTLQSGNLTLEALQQGERYLAPLANDQETLMIMTRIALAAGKPDKAQAFIRRALGMAKTS
jgi:hypothetical protein